MANYYVPMLSHEQRRARRLQMSRMVAQGASIKEAALKYGVTTRLIREACEENGVGVAPKLNLRSVQSFAILKLLLDGASVRQLVEKFRVSKQWIAQLRAAAVAAGANALINCSKKLAIWSSLAKQRSTLLWLHQFRWGS